jgi:hypothetical protein
MLKRIGRVSEQYDVHSVVVAQGDEFVVNNAHMDDARIGDVVEITRERAFCYRHNNFGAGLGFYTARKLY